MPSFFREDLLERRAMALAVIHAAGDQHHGTRRIKADLGMLVIAPAARGDRGRHADTQQFASLFRGLAAFTAEIGKSAARSVERSSEST